MSLFKTILGCLFYCITMCLHAQNDSIKPIKIECKVIDEKTKKPIEYATVILMSDTLKKGKFTDIDGKCFFDSLLSRTYTLSISFPGYFKTTIIDITPSITSKVFNIELHHNPYNRGCYFSAPIINKTEPTHDNFNSRQIMRMPY